MGSYVPSTQAQREQMLRAVGLENVMDLYRDVPEQMLLPGAAAHPRRHERAGGRPGGVRHGRRKPHLRHHSAGRGGL